MAISLVSTGLSLVTPYLSKDLVDRALVGRDLAALWRIVGLFAAARRRQLRAERGQRAALHARVGGHPLRHAAGGLRAPAAAVAALLRPHPPRRHRVAPQQRHRRDPARRRRGGAGLGRQRPVPGRLRGDAAVARLAAGAGHGGDHAAEPVDAGALPPPARGARRRPAPAQRRHRQLPDRDAAGLDADRDLERAGARARPLLRG